MYLKLFYMEIWKDIKGWVGYYQVSNKGNVKRLAGSPRTRKDRVLVLKKKASGYNFVCFSRGGNPKYYHVHRLVAKAFIPNPENKLQVNHKDLDKSNNNVKNLEWCTPLENNIHARKNKVFKNSNKKGLGNKRSKQIAQYRNGSLVFIWKTANEAAEYYNISQSAILKACRNNGHSISFKWRFVSKDFYMKNINQFKVPPKYNGNKRLRDNSAAVAARIRNINEKYTKNYLIKKGLECMILHGNLYRRNYDPFSRKHDTLTYIPTGNRFGSWKNFVNEVTKEYFKTYVK